MDCKQDFFYNSDLPKFWRWNENENQNQNQISLSHELAKVVQTRISFTEKFYGYRGLTYLETYLDSSDFVRANRKITPRNGYLHTFS